jgi:HK97 family phage major capsid protein
MSPKTYQSSTAYSRQLLAQAVIDVDNLVRNDLATDVALAIDSAGISGAGSPAPTGILSTSGVQSFTLKNDAGNGSVVVWDDIVGMEALIEAVNADQVGDPAWLTTPGVKALLKRTPQLVSTPPGSSTTVNVTGNPIWEKGDDIDGRMARQSNQVPSTLTKGTSAGDVHALIYGVFSTLVNGMWGSGFELIVDPYRLKKQGLIELTTFVLTDWANRYPVAFAVAKDVTLT